MTQYIDKAAIVEEIKKIATETAMRTNGSMFYGGMSTAFIKILAFIDTLDVKEM